MILFIHFRDLAGNHRPDHKVPISLTLIFADAPTIFSQLGLDSTETSLLATGVVGIVMFLATIPAVLYVDRVGRKPVLAVGAIGMATCHIIIAVIIAKNRTQWETQAAAGWAAVAMVWLFVVSSFRIQFLLLQGEASAICVVCFTP